MCFSATNENDYVTNGQDVINMFDILLLLIIRKETVKIFNLSITNRYNHTNINYKWIL